MRKTRGMKKRVLFVAIVLALIFIVLFFAFKFFIGDFKVFFGVEKEKSEGIVEGGKVGMGPGRFPIKTASEVLKLLNSLEANAQFKGLDTNSLVIVKMVANRAPKTWRYGRQRRRVMKRAHVDL